MHRFFLITMGLIVCSISQFVFPSFLRAFGGYLEPGIGLKEHYSDNFLLDPDVKKAVFGTTISPNLKLQLFGERIDASGDVAANINRFLGESDFDTTDYFFSFSPIYKREGGNLKLKLAAKRETTLQDESGKVQNRSKRNLLTVHPSGEFSITEYTSVGFGYRFNMADYSNEVSTGLLDYRDQAAVASLLYQATERSRVSVSLSYSNYRVPSQGSSENTANVQVGITHDFSDTSQGRFSTGVYQSSQRGTKGRGEGFLLSGGVNKKFEQIELRANVDRRVVPSGAGSLTQNDHFSFFLKKKLAFNIDGSLSLNLYENQNISDDNARKSTYNQVAPALHWFWTDEWFLNVSYSYTWAKNEDGKQRRANAGFLMLTYKWPKSIFSFQLFDSSLFQTEAP